MKRIVWLLVLVVAMTAVSSPLQAAKEKKAKRGKRAKSGLRGEYAVMASVLKFTDAQKTQLAEKLKVCAAEAKAWSEANADKLAEIKKQQAEARKNKDKDAMRKIAADSKALRAQGAAIKAKSIAAARAILTPAQKQQWAGFTVYRSIMRRFKRVGLTEDQDRKVRELCNAKAKDIPADDKKAAGRAYRELSAAITDSILTPEQKAKLTAKAPRKPRDKKAPGDDKNKPRRGRKDKGPGA